MASISEKIIIGQGVKNKEYNLFLNTVINYKNSHRSFFLRN